MRMIAELAVRGNYTLLAEQAKNARGIILRLLERGEDIAASLIAVENGVVSLDQAEKHFSALFSEAIMRKSFYQHQREEDRAELEQLYELIENFFSNVDRFDCPIITLGQLELNIKLKGQFASLVSAVFNARNHMSGETSIFNVLRQLQPLDKVQLDVVEVEGEKWRIYHDPLSDPTVGHRRFFKLRAVNDTESDAPENMPELLSTSTLRREILIEFKQAWSVTSREQLQNIIMMSK